MDIATGFSPYFINASWISTCSATVRSGAVGAPEKVNHSLTGYAVYVTVPSVFVSHPIATVKIMEKNSQKKKENIVKGKKDTINQS